MGYLEIGCQQLWNCWHSTFLNRRYFGFNLTPIWIEVDSYPNLHGCSSRFSFAEVFPASFRLLFVAILFLCSSCHPIMRVLCPFKETPTTFFTSNGPPLGIPLCFCLLATFKREQKGRRSIFGQPEETGCKVEWRVFARDYSKLRTLLFIVVGKWKQ